MRHSLTPCRVEVLMSLYCKLSAGKDGVPLCSLVLWLGVRLHHWSTGGWQLRCGSHRFDGLVYDTVVGWGFRPRSTVMLMTHLSCSRRLGPYHVAEGAGGLLECRWLEVWQIFCFCTVWFLRSGCETHPTVILGKYTGYCVSSETEFSLQPRKTVVYKSHC